MESALNKLDSEGLFGQGAERNNTVINVEFMTPDTSNAERAKRLNPAACLDSWLREASE